MEEVVNILVRPEEEPHFIAILSHAVLLNNVLACGLINKLPIAMDA
jgi:hypothetical protein